MLWRRHERVTDLTFLPGANISFRSGYTIGAALEPEDYQFKVIPDPNTSTGEYGDVLYSSTDYKETLDLMNSCMEAWLEDPNSGVTPETAGIFVVNARQYNQFIDGTLQRSTVAGQGLEMGSSGLDYPHPALVVVDTAVTREGWPDPIISPSLELPITDPSDLLLAHELGHDLSLQHVGDNAYFDTCTTDDCPDDPSKYCQPNDLNNLMNRGNPQEIGGIGVIVNNQFSTAIEAAPSFRSSQCILTDQVEQARTAAKAIPGCTFDERTQAEIDADVPPRFVPCSSASLEVSPDSSDGGSSPPAPVNIRGVSVQTSPDGGTLSVTHEVFAPLDIEHIEAVAGEEEIELWSYLDWDDNPTTGGEPQSALSSPTAYPGAELVLRLKLSVVEQTIIVRGPSVQKILQVSADAWQFDGNSFVAVPAVDVSSEISASLMVAHTLDSIETSPGTGLGGVKLPMSILGGALPPFFSLGGATTLAGQLKDELPARRFSTGAPVFPECSAKLVNGRSELSIFATGLLPNHPAHVLVGIDETFTPVTDATGSFSATVGIPAGTEERIKLITIGSENTALTADCVVEIDVPEECKPGQDTQPPVFVNPPGPVTINDCSTPVFGQPEFEDNCGATLVSDAPAHFPLGATTVTWTLRDYAGNEATHTQLVTAELGDDPSCCPSGSVVLLGTPGSDLLNGTSADECILGLGGDDIIAGHGGNDFISGGAGRDTINTGAGDDYLSCGPGNDVADSSLGDDIVLGGAGVDTLNVSLGNDVLDGGPDFDICSSTPGDQVSNCP